MDKNTILESMEHIDPKLIEDADCGVKSGRSIFNKSMLVAACICLLLITTALAAGFFFGTPEIEYHEDHHFNEDIGKMMDGFRPVLEQQTDAESASTKVSLECFSEAFLADVANKPENDLYYYYFDAWSDMEEYIGFNMFDNPVLDDAQPWTIEEYIGFNMWDNPVLDDAQPWKFEINGIWTHGYLSCAAIDGILTGAGATARYNMNYTDVPSGYPGINNSAPVSVLVEATVFTEHSPIEEDDMFHEFYYEDGTKFTDELYTSPNGHSFRIVRVQSSDDKLVSFYGLACINNVYISVQSIFYNDEAVALSTLKEVLDGFVIE